MTTYTRTVQLTTGLELATFIKQQIDEVGAKLIQVDIAASGIEATLTFERT